MLDRGSPNQVKPKAYGIGIYCLSALRSKTEWLRIRIMCLEWSDMSSAFHCFSKLAL